MSVGIARLREDAETVRAGAIAKGEDPALVDAAIEQDARRRDAQGGADALRNEKKGVSERIGAAMKGGAAPGDSEVAELRARSVELDRRIAELGAIVDEAQAALDELLLRIPNPPDTGIPVGGPEASVIVRGWGTPLPAEATAEDGTTWRRRPHWEVGEGLGLFDLAAGAKIAGSGFPLYRGAGAALQRALIDLFLGIHTHEHGMTEVWPPIVVNQASARGTGQIPDKEDQMYVVTRDDLYLVPTAEVPVTNIHRDEIIESERLPIRYVAYTPCFRREAGAAGAKTRGIVRVHQFDKVEMVLFERPAESDAALEWLTARAEVVLQRLELPYRVKLMATGDMGFTQAKKYDLEVWAPGVEDWLEVSSVSNFRDFQARRMNIRWRSEAGTKPEVLHTLNGSGLALSRVVVAILETGQQPDGSVVVPHVLRSRLGERLGA